MKAASSGPTGREAGVAAAAGRWEEARAAYRAEAERTGSAESYEGLGTAAWWLQDVSGMLDARLTAYRLYRARADDAAAARMAVALGNDFLDFRGDPAVANGWFRRAGRLLEAHPGSEERAWLRVWEARLALAGGGAGTAAGLQVAEQAIELARACGCADAEVVALAMLGLAQVMAGDTADGMAQLDEAAAAALGGDISDAYAAGLTCCYLISACERVRDYERASQWCARLREFSTRHRFAILLTQCRLQYSSVLISGGAWQEAEVELESAIDDLASSRPVVLPAAYARLGELRRRQGRIDEALELFDRAANHPIAQLGCGWIELERGDAGSGLERARGYLRRFPATALLERAPGNELLIHCAVALGLPFEAQAARAEVHAASAAHALGSLRALSSAADAVLALDAGDHENAARHFQQAMELFDEAQLPYEAGQARRGLAAALRRQEPRARQAGAELTDRELEVLRLVADGLTERDIAQRLTLSQHTVHRHISNIRLKLGVASRAAAVAQALRAGLL